MRSVLEHEPELVSGIGLITVRWAALESDLANLLGSLLRVSQSGPNLYYALGSFSQRIDMVEAAVRAGLSNETHIAISEALFSKIRRLWKSRNYLIHSNYVFVDRDGAILSGEGPDLGLHPRTPSKPHPDQDTDTDPNPRSISIAWSGKGDFSYERRGLGGAVTYVPVNKGSFQGHADQLSKRQRQVRKLAFAIRRGITPLRQSAVTSWSKSHPRDPRAEPQGPALPVGE